MSGDLGIPDFTSQFSFRDGAFAVEDGGFATDTGALEERLIKGAAGSMNSDTYQYQFRKVL